MTTHSLSTMLLVAVIAVLSPPLADLAGRKAPVPLVVFEIVLGILVGPDVLGWAHDDDYVHALSQFGLAMLFFMAGYEIDFDRLRGGPLSRALLGWASSVAIGVGLGLAVAPSAKSGVIVGIALSTTALGTILPVLRDAGEVGTPLGTVVRRQADPAGTARGGRKLVMNPAGCTSVVGCRTPSDPPSVRCAPGVGHARIVTMIRSWSRDLTVLEPAAENPPRRCAC